MDAQAFIISLERSTQRFQNAESSLSRIPLPAEVLHAVDGAALSEEQVRQNYQRFLHKPAYPFALNRGEIGCFLSHRNAWIQIVERKLDAALILEDDVLIDESSLAKVIADLSALPTENAYVQLPVRRIPESASVIHQFENTTILKPTVTPLRTSGQWVTREAAERLLQSTAVFDRPVDTMLQMHWVTGVSLTAATPGGISDSTAAVGGSVINTGKQRRPIMDSLLRQYHRTVYRLKISRDSRRHNSRAA